MRVTEIYTNNQIEKLVEKLAVAYGPYATKDWILNYIEPGVTQANAMSRLMLTMHNLYT